MKMIGEAILYGVFIAVLTATVFLLGVVLWNMVMPR
jgi:hypothetical protein